MRQPEKVMLREGNWIWPESTINSSINPSLNKNGHQDVSKNIDDTSLFYVCHFAHQKTNTSNWFLNWKYISQNSSPDRSTTSKCKANRVSQSYSFVTQSHTHAHVYCIPVSLLFVYTVHAYHTTMDIRI